MGLQDERIREERLGKRPPGETGVGALKGNKEDSRERGSREKSPPKETKDPL